MPTVMMFTFSGISCPARRFSLMNHGIARRAQTPVANAMSTDSPQLLLAIESLTFTPNSIPTIMARITISPRDWM
jgi:hypothetical protein